MRLNLAGHARRLRRSMTATVQVRDNGSPVWSGPASVRPTERAARVVESAGQAVSLGTYDLTLPLDATVPSVNASGDVTVTVTASRDPRLVGLVLFVKDRPLDDWGTAVRLVAVSSA